MVMHTFNPSRDRQIPESEASALILQSELQDSQNYTEKPYLEKLK